MMRVGMLRDPFPRRLLESVDGFDGGVMNTFSTQTSMRQLLLSDPERSGLTRKWQRYIRAFRQRVGSSKINFSGAKARGGLLTLMYGPKGPTPSGLGIEGSSCQSTSPRYGSETFAGGGRLGRA